MTPAAALLNFFSTAIVNREATDTDAENVRYWDAYPETAVPSKVTGYTNDAVFPYLTYNAPFETDCERNVSIAVNLWDYTLSEKTMNDAVSELSNAIGDGGRQILCDGGCIWLRRGTPFAQPMTDNDMKLKRRYINLTAAYHITAATD